MKGWAVRLEGAQKPIQGYGGGGGVQLDFNPADSVDHTSEGLHPRQEEAEVFFYPLVMGRGLVPLLQEGGPLPGPTIGSCLTLGNELSEETHVLTKQDFIGKGRPGGEQQGKGAQENGSATWLDVSDIVGPGLASGLSLASRLSRLILGLAQGPSWWRSHLSAKRDSRKFPLWLSSNKPN